MMTRTVYINGVETPNVPMELTDGSKKYFLSTMTDGKYDVDTAHYEAEALVQAEKDRKNLGEGYTKANGEVYKISFQKDDADGLLQVKAGFELGLLSTNIHFMNGTIMPITAEEFPSFALWFVEKRNGFFS